MLKREREGIGEILKLLPYDDLLSVASTSTKQMIIPETTDGEPILHQNSSFVQK